MNFLVRIYGPDDGPRHGFFALNPEAIEILLRRRKAFLVHKADDPGLDELQYTWLGLIWPDQEVWDAWSEAGWDANVACDKMLTTGDHWVVIPEEVKVEVIGECFEYERLAIDGEGFHFHAYYDDATEIVTATVLWSAILEE